MQIYDHDAQPLADLVKAAASEQGAALLVPDLQRPYVWTPSQVTLLVDSMLRGWPFGTLLLWDVRRDDLASSRPARSGRSWTGPATTTTTPSGSATRPMGHRATPLVLTSETPRFGGRHLGCNEAPA